MATRSMRNRFKIAAAVMAFFMIMLLVPAGEAVLTSASAEDYQVIAENETIAGDEMIVLKLFNDSESAIELTNPASKPVAVEVSSQGEFLNDHFNINWGIQELDIDSGDEIFGGAGSMTIPAGEEAIVAKIAPGMPDTWRQFATADHDMNLALRLVIDGVDYHLNPVTIKVEPAPFVLYDLVLSVSEMQFDENEGLEGDFTLSLTNNTGAPVVINAPVVIQAENQWSLEPGWERAGYSLLGGQTMTINSGETAEIVKVDPGPPFSWRAFYFPQIRNITAWIQFEDIGLWQSQQIQFAITGGQLDAPMIHGLVHEITDLADGTAKITITAHKAIMTDRVYHDGSEYVRESSYDILDEPLSGLVRRNFNTTKMLSGGSQELVGDVISAREVEPGKYEIIWAYTDGTHLVVLEYDSMAEDGMHGVFYLADEMYNPELEITISTLNRPVSMTQNPDTGKYEGTLTYPAARITFSADQPITAEINYRQKGSTARPLPESDLVPAGLYFDINLAGGDLGGAAILLEIDYSREDIPEGMSEQDLRICRYNETTGEWDVLPDQEIDTENQVIRVWLDSFSEFGVFEYTADDDDDEEDQVPIPVTGSTGSSLGLLLLAVLSGLIALIVKRPVKAN